MQRSQAGLLYSAQAQAEAHEATTKMRMVKFISLASMLPNGPAARARLARGAAG